MPHSPTLRMALIHIVATKKKSRQQLFPEHVLNIAWPVLVSVLEENVPLSLSTDCSK